MRTTEFNQSITAEHLNENMFKKFGARIEFDKYTREELENYRNLLRTKVDQHEKNSKFNDLLTNETYQKDKYMLGVLNTKIKEMLGESKKQLSEKAVSKSQQQAAGIALAAKKAGKKPAGKGAAAEMSKMPKKELEKFAGTKHKGLPKKVKENTEWNNPLDQFVNTNNVNYAAPDNYDYGDKAERMFLRQLKKLGIQVTGVNHEGDPVIVAMHGNKMVAWFDVENAHGYIPGANHVAESNKAKPDFLDVDKDGNKKEPFKKAAKDYASTKHKGLPAHKTEEGIEENTMKTTEAKMKKAKKDYDGDGKVETEKDEVWGSRMKAAKKAGKMEEGFEDKLDAAREKAAAKGKTKEKETAKPAAKARTVAGKNYGGSKSKADDTEVDEASCMKPKKAKKVSESTMRSQYKIIIEGLRQFIAEDEEGKAKDITAGTDMVNDFTSWMQRIGQYQTKSMIELSDSIRANFGQAEADAFKNTIQPALAEALSSLTQARETITRAVATLAGEEGAEPMGAMPGKDPMNMYMDVPPAAPDEMNMPDEFGAADAAAGGAEASGRELRENRRLEKTRKITEAHSILSKLAR